MSTQENQNPKPVIACLDVKLDRLVSTLGNLQDVDRSSLVVAQ